MIKIIKLKIHKLIDVLIVDGGSKDGSIKGNYAVGGLVGRTDSDSLILSMEKSYTTCNIEIADNPKVGGSYSGGLIGWIEKGSVEISESYSNSDINVVVEDGQKYHRLGGLIGEVHQDVKEFKLENSYYIGDIKADAEILRCGLLIGRMDTGPDETKIFNTYAMGTLTNCVNDYGEVALLGEAYPRSFPELSRLGNIQRLYGYNDDLSDYNKHCADGSGKLGVCSTTRGFTSELNQGVGAGKWMESPSCTVFTGSQALPELISNRQVSGPKCVP